MVCMALLVISLTETVLIVRLVHQQDLQPRVPNWLRHLVLERAATLLCVRDKHKFCSSLLASSPLPPYTENNIHTGTTPHTPYTHKHSLTHTHAEMRMRCG